MKKVVRDGMVALVLSGGYGSGWYHCHHKLELVFHPKLVELVEQDRHSEITEALCQEILGENVSIFVGDVDRLSVRWIPEGKNFTIIDYDGSEGVLTEDSLAFTA